MKRRNKLFLMVIGVALIILCSWRWMTSDGEKLVLPDSPYLDQILDKSGRDVCVTAYVSLEFEANSMRGFRSVRDAPDKSREVAVAWVGFADFSKLEWEVTRAATRFGKVTMEGRLQAKNERDFGHFGMYYAELSDARLVWSNAHTALCALGVILIAAPFFRKRSATK